LPSAASMPCWCSDRRPLDVGLRRARAPGGSPRPHGCSQARLPPSDAAAVKRDTEMSKRTLARIVVALASGNRET
jgi:hypothetical protein